MATWYSVLVRQQNLNRFPGLIITPIVHAFIQIYKNINGWCTIRTYAIYIVLARRKMYCTLHLHHRAHVAAWEPADDRGKSTLGWKGYMFHHQVWNIDEKKWNYLEDRVRHVEEQSKAKSERVEANLPRVRAHLHQVGQCQTKQTNWRVFRPRFVFEQPHQIFARLNKQLKNYGVAFCPRVLMCYCDQSLAFWRMFLPVWRAQTRQREQGSRSKAE